jgi:hypothetical protein
MVNLETLKKEKRKMFFKFLFFNILAVLIISVSLSNTEVTEREKVLVSTNKQLASERDSLKNLVFNDLNLLKENENKLIRESLSMSMDTSYIDKDFNINDLYVYTENQLNSCEVINKVIENKWDSLCRIPDGMPITLADMTNNSDGFGWRKHPILKRILFHEGVDIAALKGSEVFSTGNGIVEKVITSNKGYGNRIVINHGNGYRTVYAHLSKFEHMYVGKKVNKNDLIGYVGSTGLSTGPHLHYEILIKNRPVNPERYIYMENSLAKK